MLLQCALPPFSLHTRATRPAISIYFWTVRSKKNSLINNVMVHLFSLSLILGRSQLHCGSGSAQKAHKLKFYLLCQHHANKLNQILNQIQAKHCPNQINVWYHWTKLLDSTCLWVSWCTCSCKAKRLHLLLQFILQ